MVKLTMLSEMMGEIADAVRGLRELKINTLNLKGRVFGKQIENLDDADRSRLAELVGREHMSVWCFSSVLGGWNVDQVGERKFREDMTRGVEGMLRTAEQVRPAQIRLLACSFDTRRTVGNSNTYFEKSAAWVYGAYRDAVEAIAAAGYVPVIENEPGTAFGNPGEVLEFFQRLETGGRARCIWDIQNMWQSGTYPTLEVYRQLKPLIASIHLKGGTSLPGTPQVMAYRSSVATASWPAREIIGEVLKDGVSPVICLNPSHGSAAPGYMPGVAPDQHMRQEYLQDIAWLRETFAEIE
jgi:hypothetical protein